MKTEVSTDGAYINDALKCSSLNISNPKEDEPHGGLKGSNEYICKILDSNLMDVNSLVDDRQEYCSLSIQKKKTAFSPFS